MSDHLIDFEELGKKKRKQTVSFKWRTGNFVKRVEHSSEWLI